LQYTSTMSAELSADDPVAARLRLFSAASRALAEAGLDVRQVLDTVALNTTAHLADSCTISLVSGDRQFIDIVAARDREPAGSELLRRIAAEAPRLTIDEGVVGRVVRTGQALLVPHVEQPAIVNAASNAYRSYVVRFPFSSLLVVPLRARAEVVGTIALMRRSGEPYSSADVDLVSDIADCTGLAIENARLYERAEEARERAEKAVRARDHVLAIVSHDLRNPLTTIKLSATRLASELDDDSRRRGELILRSALRMERLIRDLLDVAQIEAGALAIEARPFHVETMLLVIADMLAPTLAARAQRLVVSGCDARVRVDRERFIQVIANLVGNASKFSPEGSTIHLNAEAGERTVEIVVRDEGPGIAGDALQTIFDRFVQTSSGREKRLGVGLGLAISKGITEAHGGAIRAANAPNGGASLHITLPLATVATAIDDDELAAFFGIPRDELSALLAHSANDAAWTAGPAPGVSILSVTPGGPHATSTAFLVRIAGGATYPMHAHNSDEHIMMLSGGLRDDDGAELWPGDRVTNARGTVHSSTALDGGCLLAARLDPVL
jgi:signal transduction histidine kinase